MVRKFAFGSTDPTLGDPSWPPPFKHRQPSLRSTIRASRRNCRRCAIPITSPISSSWRGTYLYLAAIIGGTLAFYAFNEWEWWLNVPVTLLAIFLIGAGQHQLTGLAHEASHHILFRNRLWNDLASDWLCMFPLFSSTQHYRLQHLAHHQFVNDPDAIPTSRN